MKTLLTLLLLIPSLSWGSEQKARELYVKAKSDLMNKGCEFEMLATKFASIPLIHFFASTLDEKVFVKALVL